MPLKLLLGSAALLSGVLAGFYFAYATVITAQRAVPDGAEAMRRMNIAVERPPFLAVFLLAPLLAVIAAIWLVVAGEFDARTVAGVLGAVCAVAALVLTIAINVPLNQRLTAGTVEWVEYARTWGKWNVVRTWLCVVGAVGLVLPALR
ncbi:anthrone oxygenase family protein [Tsukamurella hominis]|uniref:anthrone oxygenase family protein n=1 Tax=Tsukamurella hominis TaxID=1970232 RepID=UPI0039E7A234